MDIKNSSLTDLCLRFACCQSQMRDYEEIEICGERCVATQTSPISSEDEEQSYSGEMNKYIDADSDLRNVEYEEVVLKRSKAIERLGITLCYGSVDDNDTDIFISEIEPGSTADLDGRLRRGDQVLQVNGTSIHSRLDAIKQFRSNRSEISILLARTSEADEADENLRNGIEQDIKKMSRREDIEVYDANSGNSTFEKDSGLSRTTDSDTELLPPPIRSRSQSPTKRVQSRDEKSDLTRWTSDKSLERELASLHREMETIRIECDRLICKHNNVERRVSNQVAQANAVMQTISELGGRNHLRSKTDELSSAYNTGESNRSTPLKHDYARPVHVGIVIPTADSIANNSEGIYYKVEQRPCAKKFQPIQTNSPSTSSQQRVRFRLPQYSIVLRESNGPQNPSKAVQITDCKDLIKKGYKAGTTMYTSPDKLAETIALQQRLLRQAMVEEAHTLKPNAPTKVRNRNEAASEWKIKRRCDGTRYITKRPSRLRLLKQREEQLNRERVSTDDDAVSDLKLGRYWTREERKKHIERAKERRLRHHQVLAEKCRRPADQAIVQLSHSKMMRRKGQLLFDKFTTIQEFLAHGNRDLSSLRANDGILSVTTV